MPSTTNLGRPLTPCSYRRDVGDTLVNAYVYHFLVMHHPEHICRYYVLRDDMLKYFVDDLQMGRLSLSASRAPSVVEF